MKNALQIDYRPVSSLAPYAKAARVHSPAQIAEIAGSIERFGFNVPILIRGTGEIVSGHGRVLAAKKLRFDEVPCIVIDHLTDDQVRAFRLADNRLAENATWDIDVLKAELAELKLSGIDLLGLGWNETDMAALLMPKAEGLSDPDDVPEVPKLPVSVAGDVWECGSHRVICGDATDAAVVAKLLGGVKPHLMVTDPPYGVEYDANWRNDQVQAGNGARGAPSGRAVGAVLNDNRADWREAWALFPGDVAYVWHASLQGHIVAESLIAESFNLRAVIIWSKTNIAIGRGDYHWQHEPCFYAVRKSGTGHWNGDRKQSTIWSIEKPQKSETGHSTQKPVDCMRRPIENNSAPGQPVYDPFLGSGTTMIAAEMAQRICFGVELNPAYVDVIISRWATFTGRAPILLETGETFAEVTARRAPDRTPKIVIKDVPAEKITPKGKRKT